ncbi:MAG: hypothetical protein KDJ35_01375 [Alphaproteobacteria bacterium]|nr:hypothetical protein [Alphaproteobacteria bacterium]
MVSELSAVFNRQSNDPVTSEPILLGVREHDGVKQYMVHQFKGFMGVGFDDVYYLNEADYQKLCRDNPPRTLDDLKNDYSDAAKERYEVLKQAKDLIEENTTMSVDDYGLDGLDKMQAKIESKLGELTMVSGKGGIVKILDELDDLVDKVKELEGRQEDIEDRFEEIGEDLLEKGEPVPCVVQDFKM